MNLDHTIVASGDDLVAVPSQHSNGLVMGRDTVVQQTIEPNPTECAVHLSCDDARGEGEGFSHISIIYIPMYMDTYPAELMAMELIPVVPMFRLKMREPVLAFHVCNHYQEITDCAVTTVYVHTYIQWNPSIVATIGE